MFLSGCFGTAIRHWGFLELSRRLIYICLELGNLRATLQWHMLELNLAGKARSRLAGKATLCNAPALCGVCDATRSLGNWEGKLKEL